MGKIKNFEALAKTNLRRVALEIAEAGYTSIDTQKVITDAVRFDGATLRIGSETIDLGGVRRLVVVGVGKCAFRAVKTLEEILGDRISGGVVIDIRAGDLRHVRAFQGDHPFPTERNVAASRALVEALTGMNERDLVVAVVSGGGSTLLCLPDDPSGWEKEAAIVKCLFAAGADIMELNTVRKHLSRARGGFLAAHAYPARVISLVLSDVPGDRLDIISSGPFVKDTTAIQDARAVIEKYGVEAACEFPVDGFIETPKEETYFERVTNTIVVSNITALRAMEEKARELGYAARIANAAFMGQARDVAHRVLEELHNEKPHTVLLYGGESTVVTHGGGHGGRNQEVALAGVPLVRDGELLAALASDGRDNTDHAGALCDILTKEETDRLGLDPKAMQSDHTSYDFFEQVGDYLETGETGSNVSDLIIAIKE